jgi:hypothetical protein
MTMKNARVSVSLAVVVLAAIASTFAATDRSSPRVSAGDLSRELSTAARSAGAGGISERLSALAAGRGADSALTEAGAVTILQRVGFAATTSNPDRPLTRDRADALVRQFRAWAANSAGRGGALSERSDFPEGVDSCFDENNHGQCVACCKGMGGSASTCAKACMVINKPSASEPLP